MNEITELPMSFTTDAWPTSPQWIARVPIAIITGISSSWTAGAPPVMKSSVPFSAPSFDPVIGASSMSAPRARNASATRRARPGEMVDASR
jgi:hypothetical protein